MKNYIETSDRNGLISRCSGCTSALYDQLHYVIEDYKEESIYWPESSVGFSKITGDTDNWRVVFRSKHTEDTPEPSHWVGAKMTIYTGPLSKDMLGKLQSL